MHRSLFVASLALALLASQIAMVSAANPELTKVRSKSVQYLKANQSADGSWSAAKGPAITALCVMALLDNGVPASDPAAKRGLKYLPF